MKRNILTLFICVLAISLNAQKLSFSTYTNQNYINDLKIDNDTLWAATSGGAFALPLNGNPLHRYTSEEGFVDYNLRKVFIDETGTKWFSSFDAISKFDNGKSTNYEVPKNYAVNGVFSFGKSSDGKLWLGTNGNEELVQIDGTDTTKVSTDVFTDAVVWDIERNIESLWFGTWAGVYKYANGNWTNFTEANGLVSNTVSGIATVDENNVWIGTTAGLAMYDGTGLSSITTDNSGLQDNYVVDISAKGGHVWLASRSNLSYLKNDIWQNISFSSPSSIAVAANGEVYVGTDGQGISKVNESGVLESVLGPVTIPHNHIEDVISDNNGNIWIATRGGLAKFDGSEFEIFTTLDGLPDDNIFDIEVDKDNNIWIGTTMGISRYNGTNWETIATEDVRSITSDEMGVIWFGTISNGLFKYDGALTQFTTADGLVSNSITSLIFDHDNVLWIGTTDGLMFYNGTFARRLGTTFIESLAIDSINRVWAGTFDAGIKILKDNSLALELTQSNLFDQHHIRNIAFIDADVYCTTNEGLGVYSNGKWATYSLNDGLPRPVTSIYASETDLWVGSTGGLSVAKIESETEVSQNNGYGQELAFVKRIGSNSIGSGEEGNSIALDASGNLFLTGSVDAGSMGAIFGEGETNETTLNINGAFVAKYNDSLELEWVEQLGALNNSITGHAVATDLSGNVYVSGSFFREATFGSGQVNETTLSGTSGEIFLAKFDPDGNLIWAINVGGDEDDPGGRGLAVDKTGNSYMTGAFNGTVTFGLGEANETTFFGESTDIFIAKYNPDGVLEWVKNAGGPNPDGGKNIDLDENGNIIITGNYFDSAIFGKGLSNETTLDDSNESAFIAKYDKDGDFLWAIEPFRSGTGDISGDIEADKEGSVFFTGAFFGSILLGAGTSNETIFNGTGENEIILAKYDPNGEFVWAKSAKSTGGDRGVALAMDSISNLFVTGYFGSQIQFGENEKNDTTIMNAGSSDIYIAKFSPAGDFIWAATAGGDAWEQGKDIQIDKEGNAYVTGFYRSNLVFGKGETNETSLPIEGFTDIFIAKYNVLANTSPEFEIAGQTVFLEDFVGEQVININQINTPENELNQVVSYSISPQSSEIVKFDFDNTTGTVKVSALLNAFGEQIFTITADDGGKENSVFSQEFSIIIEPVNDPPQIDGLLGSAIKPVNEPFQLTLEDLSVNDVDNSYPTGFSLTIKGGENYRVSDNEITPRFDFMGSLNVPIKVNDGELDSDEFIISFDVREILGLNDALISDKFSIYPNPTSDLLTVLPNTSGGYQIKIFSLQGDLVHSSSSIDDSEKSIDISELKDGMYLLQISRDGENGVMRLMKN